MTSMPSWDFWHSAVRKVKMALDPPKGCNFSVVKSPRIKLDSIQYRLSNLQSALSSGWQALRKIRVTPHLPAKKSFSRQSLAYVHASTQYIKQVSGLLKVGVTTLRSSSSSYEPVQGMLVLCFDILCMPKVQHLGNVWTSSLKSNILIKLCNETSQSPYLGKECQAS